MCIVFEAKHPLGTPYFKKYNWYWILLWNSWINAKKIKYKLDHVTPLCKTFIPALLRIKFRIL